MEQLLSENCIEEFKSWALRLGCPPNSLPGDAALLRFMKSSDPASLNRIMNSVRPREEVQAIRNNIFFQSVSAWLLMSKKQQNKLPPYVQHFKKIGDLKGEIAEIRPRVEALKTIVLDKQISISNKGVEVRQMSESCENNQMHCIQLEQTRNHLTEKIAKEKNLEVMLRNSLPIDATFFNKNWTDANNSVQKIIILLGRVYETFSCGAFPEEEKEKLKVEFNKLVSGIPAHMLFNAIKAHNDNQLKVTDELGPYVKHDNAISGFNEIVTNTKSRIYQINLNKRFLQAEYQSRVEEYMVLYDQYLVDLVNKMQIFNSFDSELFAESICRDYLDALLTSNSSNAIFEYRKEKLTKLHTIVSEREVDLKRNDLVISELTDLYEKIEKTYNENMDALTSLGEVNTNLKHLQSVSKYSISSNYHRRTRNLSMSNTANSAVSLQQSSTNPPTLKYLNELLMLIDTPDIKYNELPALVSMEIDAQPLNIIFSPLHPFLTQNVTLKELQLTLAWHMVIKSLTKAIEVDITVPEYNFEPVALASQAETRRMWDLLEQYKIILNKSNKSATETEKYLKFLLDTSFGSFIPSNVKICGRTYQDFEEEFLCACNIIKNSFKNFG